MAIDVKQVIRTLVTGNTGVTDLTINGKCTKCGECCGYILPVTQNEINTIAEYVISHNIKPQKQMLVMESRLACPYFNGKKCVIYEARPYICKAFYCNRMPNNEEAKKMTDEKRVATNMWKIAEDIEKRRCKND